MSSSVFGPIGHPGELEGAVKDRLRLWMPTYVKRFAEYSGIKLVAPQSYSTATEAVKFPERKLPAIVVVSTGQLDAAEQFGDGRMDADFSVGVFIAVQGKDDASVRAMGMSYWWPILASLMQHRRVADNAVVKEQLGSEWSEIPVDQRRSRAGVEHAFSVRLENFLNVGEGPAVPIPDETDEEYPEVASTEVDVEEKASPRSSRP